MRVSIIDCVFEARVSNRLNACKSTESNWILINLYNTLSFSLPANDATIPLTTLPIVGINNIFFV